MKKSCLEKELKLVTTNNVDILNDSELKKLLREDQNEINRKLLESGIRDEELSWLEKNNIVKEINVSLSRAGSQIIQNTSASLAKVSLSQSVKCMDNYVEISKTKDDIISNFKSLQGDTDQSTSFYRSLIGKNIKELSSNSSVLNPSGSVHESSKKLAKKVHYSKIQVEGASKEECNILIGSGKNKQTICGKKRASPLNKRSDLPKKPKMEQPHNKDNEEVNSQESNVLKVELELQKKRDSIPFKRRDIKALVAECEFRNKKWKETFSKYSSPTQWGIPIVKNCTHKWDGKQIPEILLHRYQKYLFSKNLYHPLYLPVNLKNSEDSSAPESELFSHSSSCISSRTQNKSNTNAMEMNFGQEIITREEGNETELSGSDNFNPSTSNENGGRMVLRNRSQCKPVLVNDDEFSSGPDDSEEWLNKQKSGKKSKNNSKSKKSGNLSNQQLIFKLEKCTLNKNLEAKNEDSFSSASLVGDDSKNQINIIKSKSLMDPDTMVCPICSLRFKKQLIESHATECASKTYKD